MEYGLFPRMEELEVISMEHMHCLVVFLGQTSEYILDTLLFPSLGGS